MILMGAIFSVVLDLLQFAPLIGIAVALFSYGYFGGFYLDIISTTMSDRDEVPDWPSFSSFIDDILSPFIRLVGLVLISFLPVFALLFADQKDPWFIPAMIGAVVYGCFYFPMAVVAAQAFGGLGAALPHIVFPAVFSRPSRLLACGRRAGCWCSHLRSRSGVHGGHTLCRLVPYCRRRTIQPHISGAAYWPHLPHQVPQARMGMNSENVAQWLTH